MNSYLQTLFTDNINKTDITTIIECGSRDCLDTIKLQEYYDVDVVYAFECNPESILVCEENIKNIENVKLIPYAVFNENENKEVEFYATDMDNSIDKNIGASSLLYHRDQIEYIQKKILVKGIRLDTFMKEKNIDKIDLLCLDLQGAESLALEGLGERIYDVHYLISEISFQSYYHGDMLMPEFTNVLSDKGFKMIVCDGELESISGFGNALFENINFDNNKISLAITSFDRSDLTIRSFIQVLNNKLIDEIVIVDDHSDVNIYLELWNLINEIDNRKIKLYRNSINFKPLRNKYEAVKKCKNEWVILLDSDNVINNDYIEVVSKLDKEKDVLYCPGLPYRLDGSAMWDWRSFNQVIGKKEAGRNVKNGMFLTLLNTGNHFSNRQTYLNVIENNVIEESLTTNDAMYFSYLWLLSGNKMKVVPNLHYIHYQHGGGEGGSWFANNCKECYSVTTKLEKLIKKW